jgi:hypothetical protein
MLSDQIIPALECARFHHRLMRGGKVVLIPATTIS